MKTLTRFQMASVKRTYKDVKKLVERKAKINEKIVALAAELEEIDANINLWEAPIMQMTGGYTSVQMIEMGGVLPEEEPAPLNQEAVAVEQPAEVEFPSAQEE